MLVPGFLLWVSQKFIQSSEIIGNLKIDLRVDSFEMLPTELRIHCNVLNFLSAVYM